MNRKDGSTLIFLMLFSTLSKLLGFIREISLSYVHGISFVSDAYIISIGIPNLVFGFVAVGLLASYIPTYKKIESDDNIENANQYTFNLFSLLFFISIVFITLIFLFPRSAVLLYAGGIQSETLILATSFTRITSFSLLALIFVNIFSAYLHIKNYYLIPTLLGIPMNLIVIISIFASKVSLTFLSVGYLISVLLEVIFLLIFIIKTKYRINIRKLSLDRYIKLTIQLSIPVILGSIINQIAVIVDRNILSRFSTGAISALNYSTILGGIIQGIIMISVLTYFYPQLSKSAKTDHSHYVKISNKTLQIMSFLIIPSVIFLYAESNFVIKTIYQRGAFTSEDTILTSTMLSAYIFAVLFISLREFLLRIYYSNNMTKSPSIIVVIGIILNIISSILLSNIIGVIGVPIATVISIIIVDILMLIHLNVKKILLIKINTILGIAKNIFNSICMILVIKFTKIYIFKVFSNEYLRFGFVILIGLFSYFVFEAIMKGNIIDDIISILKLRKVRKNGTN